MSSNAVTIAKSNGTMLQQLEWLKRYRARFAKLARNEDESTFTEEQLDNIMGTVPMADAAEYYEDDPEGAADEEMSNWND